MSDDDLHALTAKATDLRLFACYESLRRGSVLTTCTP